MVLSDEQLDLEFERARDHFFNFVFVSVTATAGVIAMPLGFLIPLGPMEARTGFCFLILLLTCLLFRYIKELYARYTRMSKARRRIAFRIAARSQQTTIVAEPVYAGSHE